MSANITFLSYMNLIGVAFWSSSALPQLCFRSTQLLGRGFDFDAETVYS